jgi:hypothetical protein
MLKVNLFDDDFRHMLKLGYDSCSHNRPPTKIQYIRDQMEYDGVTIFTNEFMFSDFVDKVRTKYKVGWILEAPVIKPQIYNNIKKVEHKFDCILCYDQRLTINPKYKLISAAHCRFSDDEIGLFTKTKMVSHIVTNKFQAEGHKLRHVIADQTKNIDIFRTPFDKVEAHKRYRYTIIVENCRIPGYFTEKIADCIMMGAIPIYWGDPLIGRWLDVNGIITFNSVQDLMNINLSEYDYVTRYQHVVNNYNICKEKYMSVDDGIAILLKEMYNIR